MPTTIYRDFDLVEHHVHETQGESAELLIQLLRDRWAYLREQGWAGDKPVEFLTQRLDSSDSNGDQSVQVIELFRWRSFDTRSAGMADPKFQDFTSRITNVTGSPVEYRSERAAYTRVVRGFNQNFPNIGGMEMLNGVCACFLSVDGVVDNYPLSVKNGVVLMHRSPGEDFDGDGRREMYLSIAYHGGHTRLPNFGNVRVEQNFDLPNDGIVKSNNVATDDFPATALWRVAWRIQTPMGPVVTDPEKPLVFGPSIANHYPPVGTEFFSSTGKVNLFLEKSMERIGTLEPRRLTAFDIITTRDDEIFDSVLNQPKDGIFELFDEKVAAHEGELPTFQEGDTAFEWEKSVPLVD